MPLNGRWHRADRVVQNCGAGRHCLRLCTAVHLVTLVWGFRVGGVRVGCMNGWDALVTRRCGLHVAQHTSWELQLLALGSLQCCTTAGWSRCLCRGRGRSCERKVARAMGLALVAVSLCRGCERMKGGCMWVGGRDSRVLAAVTGGSPRALTARSAVCRHHVASVAGLGPGAWHSLCPAALTHDVDSCTGV